MARNKYYKYEFDGTFKCGHEGTIKQGGYTRDYAESEANRQFENYVCPECEKLEKQKQYKKEAEIEAEKAKELGLPELEGSEKQVQWALNIRPKFYDRFIQEFEEYDEDWIMGFKEDYPEDFYETDGEEEIREALNSAIKKLIETETSSTFYIERRNFAYFSLETIYSWIKPYLPKNREV